VRINKWILYVMVISLLANGYMAWKLYYPNKPTQSQIVAYDQSIYMLKEARQYVKTAAKTTGTERNSAMFNAFQSYESAEIFLGEYREKFKTLGIAADQLNQALVMNRGEIIVNTSHALNGKSINLQGITAVLEDIVSKLPTLYERSNIAELRTSFSKLKYY
jgi:nitric oxide reductase large subunit